MSDLPPFQQEYRPRRTLLQNFHIDWNDVTQSFRTSKRLWPAQSRPATSWVAPLLDWPLRPRGQSRTTGQRFTDMFLTKLDIGNDDEWHFAHGLGRGGFGVVALFEQRDTQSQTIVDSVVVKTTKITPHEVSDRLRQGLSNEAALMAQTNELEEDGMLVLRNYKYYHREGQWKYYLEYCPFGDLERLRVRYKAYGRYLPELFLWHLFWWLAKTVHEYSNDENSWHHTSVAGWGNIVPGGFLLHSDIKPQNVMLGPPDPETSGPIALYPIPRMGDLGLAEIQSQYLPSNSALNLLKGTRSWFPPELRPKSMHKSTPFYPFGPPQDPPYTDRFWKFRHKITSKANLWAIGAVMFSMMTLSESNVLSEHLDHIMQEHYPPPTGGDSIIDDHDFRLLPGQYYSIALRDTIKSCLMLRPEDRPDEAALLATTSEGYHSNLLTLQNLGYGMHSDMPSLQEAVHTHPDYKVYFRDNEIDSAPDNYQFDHPGRTDMWWQHHFIRDFPWIPPHWGRLWPDTMPLHMGPADDWPQAMKDGFYHVRACVQLMRHQANEQQQHQRRRQQQHIALQSNGEGRIGPFAMPSYQWNYQQQPHSQLLVEQFQREQQRAVQQQQQQQQPAQGARGGGGGDDGDDDGFNTIGHLGLHGQPGFDGNNDDPDGDHDVGMVDTTNNPTHHLRFAGDDAQFTQVPMAPQGQGQGQGWQGGQLPSIPPTPGWGINYDGGMNDTPRPPAVPGASGAMDDVQWGIAPSGPVRTQRNTPRVVPYPAPRRRGN